MEKTKHEEFLALYEPIHVQLSRFCRAISGNREDAEDLMNDTILIALEQMVRIKNKSLFKAYLFSIASNINKMRFRRTKFRVEFSEKEINQIIDLANNPEDATEFRIIYDKMLALTAKTSETLILFHISDLSIEEIQKIQGGSISGVKLRLKRGREKLLKLLESPRQRELAIMLFTF